MDHSEIIYCAYSYSEGRWIEAAHKIQRAMEQWHHRVMMLPQNDELFLSNGTRNGLRLQLDLEASSSLSQSN